MSRQAEHQLTDRRVEERIGRVALGVRPALRRLRHRIERRERSGKPASLLRERLARQLEAAEREIEHRRAVQPIVGYPAELPIVRHREEILRAMAEYPVIVVCGDTGTGKTTQLPKLCLEAGRGIVGTIGMTQPRRIAARAVAGRLAHELGARLGEAVGLKLRFTDRTGPASLVKVMTDGILLNEIRADRGLHAYDTLIIDEAHERSLNVDFILGYLKHIRASRPDLKVIITSATIDPDRFAAHFDDAPVLKVEGRSHPVEIRYRAPLPKEDVPTAVVGAVRELADVDLAAPGGGEARDMLVFLPGERWIRDTEQALRRARIRDFEILPLYARLAAGRQDRVFKPGRGPRIVLATNVAETSLTVPRIRFVVDAGLARVSRYSPRHRLQGLDVEPIAQANATQRAGRCGRLAPGVCIRLYSEQDFETRPAFADPEILRTNLAGVVLRLETLGFSGVEDFPFMDPPPARAINDAYRLLQLLGAMDEDRRMSEVGRRMAELPLDPRLGRLLIGAERTGALAEGLVIAAALSVVDARESSKDQPPSPELSDERSDFVTYLKLWTAYRRERRAGRAALGGWCKTHSLSLVRLREWDDVHGQLRDIVGTAGWSVSRSAASYEAIHEAVLAAFVDLIAEKHDGRSYRGVQQSLSSLFPGTPVAKKAPRWIVAAERFATDRPYLRVVAQVNPRWVLRAAPHLIRREHRDPVWDRRRGLVTAVEVLKFSGLILSQRRRVDYGPVAPEEARRLFVRDALVADALGVDADFQRHNAGLRRTILDYEARLRVRDLLVGERALEAFYASRLPPAVRDRRSLLEWCRDPGHAERLRMGAADVLTREMPVTASEDYPDTLTLAGQSLPLRYRYDPAADDDGITVRIPRLVLPAVRAEQLDWIVPGRLPEKIQTLLRSLPKDLRRQCVPLPDTVRALLPALRQRCGKQRLVVALSQVLAAERSLTIGSGAFAADTLPPHLSLRIEIVDETGSIVATGRDIEALKTELGVALDAPLAGEVAAAPDWDRRGLAGWDFGELPQRVRVSQPQGELMLYPALLDIEGRVDLSLLPPGPPAERRHRAGLRRLITKALPQQATRVRRMVRDDRPLLLAYHGIGTADELSDDLLLAAVEAAFALDPPARDRAAFERCLGQGRARFVAEAERLHALLAGVLHAYRRLRGMLSEAGATALPAAARQDLEQQLGELVYAGFLSDTPPQWQPRLPRYLEAMQVRCRKLRERHPKDADFQARAQAAWRPFAEWRAEQAPDWPWPAPFRRYRWLVEEFRVSLFAQSLGSVERVSERRLEEAWHAALAAAPAVIR